MWALRLPHPMCVHRPVPRSVTCAWSKYWKGFNLLSILIYVCLLPLRMLTQSPGNRLSHLAKRRAIFSSANLATNSIKLNNSMGPQILLDKKYVNINWSSSYVINFWYIVWKSRKERNKRKATPKRKTPGSKKKGKFSTDAGLHIDGLFINKLSCSSKNSVLFGTQTPIPQRSHQATRDAWNLETCAIPKPCEVITTARAAGAAAAEANLQTRDSKSRREI